MKNRTAPHHENLKEDYNRVFAKGAGRKSSSALEKWFKEHIPTYYISIDKDFSNCSGLEEWRKSAAECRESKKLVVIALSLLIPINLRIFLEKFW